MPGVGEEKRRFNSTVKGIKERNSLNREFIINRTEERT